MKRMMIAALALSAALLTGCGVEPAPTVPPVEVAPTVPAAPTLPTEPATVPAEIPREGIPVETPCGTLYLPDDWDEPIRCATAHGDPVVITFLAEDVPLYDLIFSETTALSVGQVQTDGGLVYVGMTIHPLERQTDLLLSMQESVNILLSQLAPEPVTVQPTQPQDTEDIRLDTRYGVLRFPLQWEDCLMTRWSADDALEFCCRLPEREPVLIFTVLFGRSGEGPAAAVTAPDGTRTELVIQVAEPVFGDDWTASETDTVYAMQEDMNYLLDALRGEE